MIEVRHLTKRYGSTLAVDDLNFTIEKGQIYGFLGPNGAGKSTTMNIITGYIASTDGTVTIDGHDILENPEAAKKNIGYLPELPPLYFDMTVEEYLLFAAELKKIPKKERASQLADICALTKVEEVLHRLIKNLSKGYRQRVGLAQALLGYPEILILDDPTVCDYVLIISHGKLVASDTPDNLSKLMQGTSSLLLTVKSSQEDLENLLNTIPAVQEFHFTDCEEKDCVKAEIKTEPSADIRELLFYRLAEAGLPILGMQLVHLSLEDIFLELTADDTQSFTESASSIDQKGDNLDDLHM